MIPDYPAARAYALNRLQRELPAALCYHTTTHTAEEVLPATQRLAAAEDVSGEGLLLLLTAACFHDIGFVECYQDNEIVGVRIARETLPGLGYSPAQLEAIAGMILATRLPQAPRTLLEAILADADLDVLGRPDFLERNELLRQELAAQGIVMTDLAWRQEQFRFISSHSYFTAAARQLRAAGEAENCALMQALVAQTAEPS